jgi:hypothetical protein
MISKILNTINPNRNKIINSFNSKNSIKFLESNFYSYRSQYFFTMENIQTGKIKKIFCKNFISNKNFHLNFSSKNQIGDDDDNEDTKKYFDDLKIYENMDNGIKKKFIKRNKKIYRNKIYQNKIYQNKFNK